MSNHHTFFNIFKLFAWKATVRGYSKSTREGVSRGKSYNLLPVLGHLANYIHFQCENKEEDFAVNGGKEGVVDHQREAAKVSRRDQKMNGAKAHLKGER